MYTIVDGITTMNSLFDVLVIGQKGVGKTTLLRKYVTGSPDTPNFELAGCLIYKRVEMPCHCLNPSSVSSEDTVNKQMSILNSSAGVDTLLTQNSYQVHNAQTMVFAYSAASSESFEALEYTINCIESVKDTLPPCVIVGLNPGMNKLVQVLHSQGEALAKSCGALLFVEADLYDDSIVDKVFDPLVEHLFHKDKLDGCSVGHPEKQHDSYLKLKDRGVDGRNTERVNGGLTINDSAERSSEHLLASPPNLLSRPANLPNQSGISVHRHPTEKLDDFRTPSLKSLESTLRSFRQSQTSSSKKSKATSGCCIIT